jgi:hypothetical protein
MKRRSKRPDSSSLHLLPWTLTGSLRRPAISPPAAAAPQQPCSGDWTWTSATVEGHARRHPAEHFMLRRVRRALRPAAAGGFPASRGSTARSIEATCSRHCLRWLQCQTSKRSDAGTGIVILQAVRLCTVQGAGIPGGWHDSTSHTL